MVLKTPVNSPLRPFRRRKSGPITQPLLDLADIESPLLRQHTHHPCRERHFFPEREDSIQPSRRTHNHEHQPKRYHANILRSHRMPRELSHKARVSGERVWIIVSYQESLAFNEHFFWGGSFPAPSRRASAARISACVRFLTYVLSNLLFPEPIYRFARLAMAFLTKLGICVVSASPYIDAGRMATVNIPLPVARFPDRTRTSATAFVCE
jgi:hypothetical protein